jgi:hypothetical protein
VNRVGSAGHSGRAVTIGDVGHPRSRWRTTRSTPAAEPWKCSIRAQKAGACLKSPGRRPSSHSPSGKGAPGGRSRILCPRSSLSRTAIRQLLVLASNPKNLNRPPKRQDVQLFFFLSLPVAGGPNGGGFLVNGHDVSMRSVTMIVNSGSSGTFRKDLLNGETARFQVARRTQREC